MAPFFIPHLLPVHCAVLFVFSILCCLMGRFGLLGSDKWKVAGRQKR